MPKNPHKPFNVVTNDDGKEILEARPMFDTTMVVRKPLPSGIPTVPVIEKKSDDLVAPEPVNKKKLDLK